MQQVLIRQNLLKKSVKPEVNKLDIDRLEDVSTGLNGLKIKVDKLDADKLVPVPYDLSKLPDVVKTMLLKTEYLVLQTYLQLLLLMLK